MSGTLLVPVQVEALALHAPATAPALSAPSDTALPQGVHLHWALPDALVNTRTVTVKDRRYLLFPSLPDLWLVVRFSPVVPPGGPVRPGPVIMHGAAVAAETAHLAAAPVLAAVSPVEAPHLAATPPAAARVVEAAHPAATPPAAARVVEAAHPAATPPAAARVVEAARVAEPAAVVRQPGVEGRDHGPVYIPVAWGRDARAWVVEPRTGRKTELGAWTPPTDYQAGKVFTQAGLLDAADPLGEPGWGVYPEGSTAFEAGAHAYYPECQNRFGMHDPLDDLGGAKGSVSYCVIGWYSALGGDPMAQAADPYELMSRWKLLLPWEDWLPHLEVLTQAVEGGESKGYAPVIQQTTVVEAGRAGELSARHARTLQAPRAAQIARAEVLQRSLSDLSLTLGADGPVIQVPVGVQRLGPAALACHGAVLDVSLSGGAAASPSGASALVLPSLQRALAEVAAVKQAGMDDDTKLALQAKILDADQKLQLLEQEQNDKTLPDPQLVGLPNEVHALSFQGKPGASSWFAQLTLSEALYVPWRPGRAVTRAPADRLVGFSAPALSEARSTVREVPASSAARGIDGISAVSGYWPELRSVAGGGGTVPIPTGPPTPTGPPSDAEVAAWTQQVQKAVDAINSPPPGSPPPAHAVHPHLIRVEDTREAQGSGGASAPGTPRGPGGSAYWVDLGDKDAMSALLVASRTAHVDLPAAHALYEVPGPRWYRPYSPHVVLQGVGRCYRFGFDGRFDVDGWLRCRMVGDTLSSLGANPAGVADGLAPVPPVTGAQILGSAAGWFAARSGVPALARGLLEEALLLDADSAPDLAQEWLHHFHVHNPGAALPKQADVEKAFRQQIQGNWALRDQGLKQAQRDTIEEALTYIGVMPSPVAFSPWQRQPWEPLFANISYSFTPLQPGTLDTVDVALSAGAAGPVVKGTERRYLSAVVSKVLDSAMVTKQVGRYDGKLMFANKQLATLSSETFLKMDVLSAALTGFDDSVFAAGLRLRGGALQVDSVQVVDAFGSTLTLKPGAVGGTWKTQLLPRLPDWARLQMRFMAAAEADKEADLKASPACGYLVPDLLEHTLEIYDGDGVPLGQLVSEPPVAINAADPASASIPVPAVRFEAHPLKTYAADPIDVVQNSYLRSFVDGVRKAARTEAPVVVKPGQERLRESALTALLRVIDTLRGTVDPADKHGDHKVRMLGAPVALVRARAWLERTTGGPGGSAPGDNPALLLDPVQISAKVGAVAQQDDGVLGCFMAAKAADGTDAHFRPVDAAAVDNALLNGLGDATGAIQAHVVAHTFVRDPAAADTTFTLQGAQQQELLMLLDIKGGLYLTSGVLPRKKLTLPREFLAGALSRLAPSFRVGPVLSFPADGQANPLVPPPALPGYGAQWIERGQHTAEPLQQLPPDGALPQDRCTMTEGWLSMVPTG